MTYTKMKELEVTAAFPDNYECSSDVQNDITIVRGSDYYTTIVKELPLTEQEILLLAETHLKSTLAAHSVTQEDVVFTSADTIEHCNTKGQPVYVFLMEGSSKGNYVYEVETHFKLKGV